MNRVWLLLLAIIIAAGLLDSQITQKAADKQTVIRQSCVKSPHCQNM